LPVIKRIKWKCDWNRPLSKEEREIALRLGTAPDTGPPAVAPAPQSWYSALHQERKDEALVSQEEEA
jgi:hypothetical protein